jgi:hypothetical protein
MSHDEELPEKEYLERKKLIAELNKLRSENKFALFSLVFSGLQAMAVIFGVYLGVNEFVIKDHDQKAQQLSIALALIERGDSLTVRAAKDALRRCRDEAYDTPTGIYEQKRFPSIVAKCDKETRDLAVFFKSLNRAIKVRYIDADLVLALVADDIQSVGETLDDILERMGGPGAKGEYPDLKPYCDFYALRKQLNPEEPWKKNWGFDPCKP